MISGPSDVTPAVLAAMAHTPDARLREIMLSLVRHLHDFVRETKLTEAEFRQACELVNEIGLLKSDTHNEAVLMAGSLGVSALVCLLNNGANGTKETSQNLLGPFWRMHAPRTENGGSILRSPTAGPALFFAARIIDPAGVPVADAEVDVWQASPEGLYENQDPTQAPFNLRGKFTTDADGRFWLRTVRPTGYPIPTGGVVGRMLKAQDRPAQRPAHMHVLIFKEGFKTLISQIYADDDPNLERDPQFGVTRALAGKFQRHDTPHPDAPDAGTPWYSLEHLFVLEAGKAVLPRPPIK
jgi:catechol 1,2-dioxygenase